MFAGPKVLSTGLVLLVALAGEVRAAEQPAGSLGRRGGRPGASAVGPIESDAVRVATLIKQLGSRTFAARQRAQKALIAMGAPAKQALEAACHHADWEVRSRARQALDAVLDVEFESHLNAFLADESSAAGRQLPGWERFSLVAGDTSAARRLFGDMQRAERGLMQVDDDPEHGSRLLDQRAAHFAQMEEAQAPQQPRISLGSIAAIIFAASNPDVPVPDTTGYAINRLAVQTTFFNAMNLRPTAEPLRKLVGALVSRSFEADAIISYCNIDIALRYDLKEIVGPSKRLLAGAAAPALYVHYPILALGKFGSAEHVPLIEPLLQDARPADKKSRRQDSNTEVRDVALAVLVYLTGQNLADYGLKHAKSDHMQLFQLHSLGFHEAAARESALKKWREWSLRHSSKSKP